MNNKDIIEVFIINYNGEKVILSTIQSLQNSVDVNISISVIDDASTDNSIDLVKKQYPNIPIYQMPFNQKRANVLRNKALELAKSKYVFITDNDLVFDKKCFSELYKYIKDDETIAACTPRLMYLQEPNRVYVAGTRIHFIGAAISDRRDQIYEERNELPTINRGSSICLVNREIAMKYGGFDVHLMKGWGSDGEFYHTLLLSGYKCIYIPSAFALHAAKLNIKERKFRAIGQTHNRWVFIVTHYKLSTILLLLPAFLTYEILQIGFISFNGLLPEYIRGNLLIIKNFNYVFKKRKRIQSSRIVSDFDVLYSGRIFIAPSLIEKYKLLGTLINSFSYLLDLYWRLLKFFFQTKLTFI